MRIDKRLAASRSVISFEVFPPKDEFGWRLLKDNLKILAKFKPDFISVTYGAGGRNRRENLTLLKYIKQELGLEVLAHLTCIGQTKKEISEIIEQLRKNKIENVLALRGDKTEAIKNSGDFSHASDLIRFIRQQFPDFCIGIAVYPEKHPESRSWADELKYLKLKIAAGAEFGITQMFFRNEYFWQFQKRLTDNHIHIPIIPGIMPLTSARQLKHITRLCQAKVPRQLRRKISEKKSPVAARDYGIRYALQQCQNLYHLGCRCFHFYTLNQAEVVSQILSSFNLL